MVYSMKTQPTIALRAPLCSKLNVEFKQGTISDLSLIMSLRDSGTVGVLFPYIPFITCVIAV